MANVFDHPPRLAFPIYELVLFSQKIHFCVRFTRIVKCQIRSRFWTLSQDFFLGYHAASRSPRKRTPAGAGVLLEMCGISFRSGTEPAVRVRCLGFRGVRCELPTDGHSARRGAGLSRRHSATPALSFLGPSPIKLLGCKNTKIFVFV